MADGVISNLRIEPAAGGGGATLGGMIADESCYRLSNVAHRFKIADHSLLVTCSHSLSIERWESSRFHLPTHRIAAAGGGGVGGGEIGGRRQHCTAACQAHPAACGTAPLHGAVTAATMSFTTGFLLGSSELVRGREQEVQRERSVSPCARARPHLSNFSKCDNFTQTFKFRRPLFLGPEL